MYIAPTDIFHAFVTNGISVHSAGIMFILAWKSLLGWTVYWTVLTGSDPFMCVLTVKLCLVKCYTGHFRRGIASQLPSQLCLKRDVNSEITRTATFQAVPLLPSPFKTKTGISLLWISLILRIYLCEGGYTLTSLPSLGFEHSTQLLRPSFASCMKL